MKKVQWDKKLKKQLAFLPKDEREKIVAYYDELYYDKRDAGITEEEILREFGPPEEVAEKFTEDAGARKATAGDTAARVFLIVTLYLFVGIPVLAVLLSLAATGLALFLSGFAIAIAGIADFFYFIAQIAIGGVSAAYIAHLGIGLGVTAAGLLLIPLFLWLTKKLFLLCGKIFIWTKNYIRGKKEA